MLDTLKTIETAASLVRLLRLLFIFMALLDHTIPTYTYIHTYIHTCTYLKGSGLAGCVCDFPVPCGVRCVGGNAATETVRHDRLGLALCR